MFMVQWSMHHRGRWHRGAKRQGIHNGLGVLQKTSIGLERLVGLFHDVVLVIKVLKFRLIALFNHVELR